MSSERFNNTEPSQTAPSPRERGCAQVRGGWTVSNHIPGMEVAVSQHRDSHQQWRSQGGG